jgi:hypothetical protein
MRTFGLLLQDEGEYAALALCRLRRLLRPQERDVFHAGRGDEGCHVIVDNPAAALRGVTQHERVASVEGDKAGVKKIEL